MFYNYFGTREVNVENSQHYNKTSSVKKMNLNQNLFENVQMYYTCFLPFTGASFLSSIQVLPSFPATFLHSLSQEERDRWTEKKVKYIFKKAAWRLIRPVIRWLIMHIHCNLKMYSLSWLKSMYLMHWLWRLYQPLGLKTIEWIWKTGMRGC